MATSETGPEGSDGMLTHACVTMSQLQRPVAQIFFELTEGLGSQPAVVLAEEPHEHPSLRDA